MPLDYSYGYNDYTESGYEASVGFDPQRNPRIDRQNLDRVTDIGSGYNWEFYSLPNSSVAHGAAPFSEFLRDGLFSGGGTTNERRKKRRAKNLKNTEEMESQRMSHIAVERNRRRQMNDYLATLRSLMPPSFAQRGDQASIVGGAINFVKELEQLLQFLESNKPANRQHPDHPFSDFFNFPQYLRSPNTASPMDATTTNRRSDVADIEVTMVESHANIKIQTERRPKQLVEMVARFQSIGLTILHLNVTTGDRSTLYSFNLKVEDACQLTTGNEIATTVHDILGMIQEESVV